MPLRIPGHGAFPTVSGYRFCRCQSLLADVSILHAMSATYICQPPSGSFFLLIVVDIRCLSSSPSSLAQGLSVVVCAALGHHVWVPEVLRLPRPFPQLGHQFSRQFGLLVRLCLFFLEVSSNSPLKVSTDWCPHKSLFGYDQGVTGGLLDLPSFTKYFPAINPDDPAIENDQAAISQRSTNQGIAVASYNLGCFLGAVLTIFIGNPLGRRRTIFLGCITMTTGAILQCTAYDLPHFIVGRIVTGIGNGMNTSTVPTWQSETAKAHDRGKLVMYEGALITGGITLSYWINYGELSSASHCLQTEPC